MRKPNSSLKERLKKSYADKDKGSSGESALDWKKVKGDVKFYKMTKGKHRFNIIPFIIKSKNHPLVKSGDMKIGDQDYLMDVWLHKGLGPANNAQIICQKKTFNRACPVCSLRAEYESKGKKDAADDLRPQRTAFYNVMDADSEDGELMVFQTSYALFEKELIDEARESSDDGEIIDFPDIVDGKVVSFRASEASFGGFTYFEYKHFSFEKRDEKLDEELIEKAISFDEILKFHTAEEVEKILYGDDEDEEEDEKPKGKKHDEDDDDDEEEEEKDPPKKRPTKEEDEEEEQEEEKPKPKKKDEEEEKPEKSSKPECPSGFTFGKDCDKHKECDTCDLWDICLKEQKRLEAKK